MWFKQNKHYLIIMLSGIMMVLFGCAEELSYRDDGVSGNMITKPKDVKINISLKEEAQKISRPTTAMQAKQPMKYDVPAAAPSSINAAAPNTYGGALNAPLATGGAIRGDLAAPYGGSVNAPGALGPALIGPGFPFISGLIWVENNDDGYDDDEEFVCDDDGRNNDDGNDDDGPSPAPCGRCSEQFPTQ